MEIEPPGVPREDEPSSERAEAPLETEGAESEATAVAASEEGPRRLDEVSGVRRGRDVAGMDAASREEVGFPGRFPDSADFGSDSGVSSLRSASGDERSGSRSSALSGPEEHDQSSQAPLGLPLPLSLPLQTLSAPLPLSLPLLMAHPAAPPAPQSQQPQPLAHHYPPPLLHLPPPSLYAPPDLLWSKRYPEEYLDRERHDRMIRFVSLSFSNFRSIFAYIYTYNIFSESVESRTSEIWKINR